MRSSLNAAISLSLLALLLSASAQAQLRAQGAIALTAKVPSSAALAETLYPVSIVVQDGRQSTAEVPINLKWNIDPGEASGVRVLATIVGSGLNSPSDQIAAQVAPQQLQATVAGPEFRSFNAGRDLVVLHVPVNVSNRQGRQQSSIEVKIDDARLAALPNGVYSGVIRLQVQIL